MSVSARYETNITTEDAAASLDAEFQFVADRLPTEVKTAAVGRNIILAEHEEFGTMYSTYIGNFIVGVSVVSEFGTTGVGLHKRYGLTWQARRSHGPIRDVSPIEPDLLASCPVPLHEVVCAVQGLKDQFAQKQGLLFGSPGITQLDLYRR